MLEWGAALYRKRFRNRIYGKEKTTRSNDQKHPYIITHFFDSYLAALGELLKKKDMFKLLPQQKHVQWMFEGIIIPKTVKKSHEGDPEWQKTLEPLIAALEARIQKEA